MRVKAFGSVGYARRKAWLRAKLWLTALRMGWSERRAVASDAGPDVLDRMRSREAAIRHAAALHARREDLRQALVALEGSRSPFFGL